MTRTPRGRRSPWLALLLALLLALPAATPGLAADPPGDAAAAGHNPGHRATDGPPASPAADRRYLIEFFQYGPPAATAVRALGGEVVYEFPRYRTIAARLPDAALRGLQASPNVARVEVDPRRYMQSLSAAAAGTETVPYGISMVQADQLVDTGAASRKVCIIDSGYHIGHEDLQDTGVTASPDPNGRNGTDKPLQDGLGHGSHVAGTIAALGGNGKGVVGALPNNRLLLHIVKVFGDDGNWAYSSDLAYAVGQCRTAGANVINMSLGGSSPSTTEQQAFDDAYGAGVLSIAAAGNAGNTTTSYPAGYGSVVSVAAIDSTKTVAGFSQKNADVELAAPGVDVLSTVPTAETNTVTVGAAAYAANWIEFAARTTSAGVTGTLVDGGLCTSGTAAWSGRVVLCERGDITFYEKVTNVQASGGLAAVIFNNVAGNFSGTLGSGQSSTIPAVSLSQEDGLSLRGSQLGSLTTVVSTTEPGSGYEAWSGTSMATPHVVGVAALVWSYNPLWTSAQIRQALQATAQDLGAAGRDTAYGYGLVQAKAALTYLQDGGSTIDVTAPVISNVASRQINKRGNFEITWTTNEPATSEVTFTGGTTGTYTNATLVTSHRMTFRGRKGVLYTYTLSSTDAAGNKRTAGPFTHQN